MSEAPDVSSNGPKARIVLQQCLSAKLQVQPATSEAKAEFVEIGQGLIIYLCFLKEATADILEKLVKAALTARLSEADGGKRVSVLDLPGDVLIIPQATLGGTLKGKAMQYHGNVDKELGKELYQGFVELCRDALAKSPKSQEAGSKVKWGTYGNRQVFSCETNGPYTHLVEM